MIIYTAELYAVLIIFYFAQVAICVVALLNYGMLWNYETKADFIKDLIPLHPFLKTIKAVREAVNELDSTHNKTVE